MRPLLLCKRLLFLEINYTFGKFQYWIDTCHWCSRGCEFGNTIRLKAYYRHANVYAVRVLWNYLVWRAQRPSATGIRILRACCCFYACTWRNMFVSSSCEHVSVKIFTETFNHYTQRRSKHRTEYLETCF